MMQLERMSRKKPGRKYRLKFFFHLKLQMQSKLPPGNFRGFVFPRKYYFRGENIFPAVSQQEIQKIKLLNAKYH